MTGKTDRKLEIGGRYGKKKVLVQPGRIGKKADYPVKFIDLQGQFAAYEADIRAGMDEVLRSSQFILGPKGAELERKLASYVGARHALGCSSGTDALLLALLAYGVGPGDEIITTPFTFIATAEVIALVGATPVFVDIEPETYNIDPARVEDAATGKTRGIIAVSLDDGDYLIGVALTDGKQDIMLFSDAGKALRFGEDEVRVMGRNAGGVRGMRLVKGGHVISLLTAENEEQSVLTATENGYGKRTPIGRYTRHGRGTQGIIAIQTSERNGKLVAAQIVGDDDEIMLITTGGVLIRTRISEIREIGRTAQGVRLINLGEGEKLAGLETVAERDDDEEEGGVSPTNH